MTDEKIDELCKVVSAMRSAHERANDLCAALDIVQPDQRERVLKAFQEQDTIPERLMLAVEQINRQANENYNKLLDVTQRLYRAARAMLADRDGAFRAGSELLTETEWVLK